MYLEIGLMIFLEVLCSMMWAAHPEVLAITKMGVKKSLNDESLTYEFRIDCKHWRNRNLGLDICPFPLSFGSQSSLRSRL